MMIDEIQTGFGRTGTWFGFQQHDVVPDVVTLAKAIGNGMPIGACWAEREVSAVFQPGDHGSTYSGTALATAAVSAVVDEMRRIDAPGSGAQAGRPADVALLEQIPQVDVGPRVGPAARRPTGRGHRRARPSTRRCSSRGLICNAVNAVDVALRAAAHGQRRRARRGGGARSPASWPRSHRDQARSLLDVTDLTADELRTVLELAERPVASLGRPLAGQRRGADLRQAVEPHPPVDGDRRRAARRASRLHARRRDRIRHARVGRGHRPDHGGLPRPDRRPGVRALDRRAVGGGGERAGGQHAQRLVASRCRRSPTR